MPVRARQWRVCSENGCPTLVQGSNRCDKHPARTKDDRPSASARGYDARWSKFARAYRDRHPSCAVVGCTRASKDVDHIDGQGPLGPRGYDETNLMALCHQHHSAKTAATTWSQYAARLGVTR